MGATYHVQRMTGNLVGIVMAFERGLVDGAIGKAVDVDPAGLHDGKGQPQAGDD